MDNKKLVPQIRFKGFHDEWEEIKLGDMFIRLVNKNTDNSVKNILTNSAEFGIILQNKFFKNEIVKEKALNRYSIININDFTYNPRISSNAPAGPINKGLFLVRRERISKTLLISLSLPVTGSNLPLKAFLFKSIPSSSNNNFLELLLFNIL